MEYDMEDDGVVRYDDGSEREATFDGDCRLVVRKGPGRHCATLGCSLTRR